MPLPLLLACRSPDPAPTRIEELLGWMYTHAEDDDTDTLAEGFTNADAWLDQHFDETLQGYTVDALTAEQLAVVDAPDASAEGLRGVAVGYPYTVDADQVAHGFMEWRENDLYGSEDEDSATLVSGDTACFADGSCDWVDLDVYLITDVGFGIQIETWMRYQYRRVPTDQGDILLMRVWSYQAPEITTDLFAIDQIYQIWMLLPSEDGFRSLQGEWVDARVLKDDLDIDVVMKIWVSGLIGNEEDLEETAAKY